MTRMMTRIEVDGPAGLVSALVWDGPADDIPILFLHPVNTAGAVWTDVAVASGHPAAAPDYRGHGASAPGPRYLAADYAADALAVADHLGWTRMHLVGGSLGGAVAVEIAALAPERVASIACFGSTLHVGLPVPEVEAILDTICPLGIDGWFAANGPYLLGPDAGAEVVARVVGDVVAVNRGRELSTALAVTMDAFHAADSRPAARALAHPIPPALVVVGSEDTTCPPAAAAVLAGYLDTEPVVLPGIGHLPMLEVPDEVVALLEKLHS